MEAIYHVHGMHCTGCVAKVGAALKAVPGVRAADVSLERGEAVLTLDQPVHHDALAAALRRAGDYTIIERPARETPSPDTAAPDAATAPPTAAPRPSLRPLLLIVAYILGTVVLIAASTHAWSPHAMMRHFMAGFFLVFSFFKLLDLRGFVDAYRGYDLVARAIPAWGWAYPFVELALGIAYLTALWPAATNVATLVLMLVGAAGVLKALLDKRAIRCACLGTALNLPMTTVTLVEDLTMAVMAALMLVGM